MLIDLVHLRTFIAVAEEQHLTRAAERLYISQSTASAHVRAIEETLNMMLFVRTNRSLEPTKAGELLLERAKAILSGAGEFMAYARELSDKVDGKIVLGTSTEPDTRVGSIVAQLRSLHELITVDLRGRTSASGRQGLRNGELDACLLLGAPTDPGITYYELGKVQFRVAGPIAWKDRIETADVSELAALPWIAPGNPHSAYSGMFTTLFSDRGLEMNVVASFDNPSLGRTMLENNVGMMLLRDEYVQEGIRAGVLASSPLVNANYAMSLGHQAGRTDDPLIKALVEAVRMVWPSAQLAPPAKT
ncbi:LysR family transcriptional regulator [Ottowia thiooxydans]|uniref:LysR family transcriptional regulator n=1 Tax=Ottowia thiooxydans TaxID=219182 RepID=UPI00040F8B16|nr:LysR family transcriptional regulator [Ottowia thiooxydans]